MMLAISLSGHLKPHVVFRTALIRRGDGNVVPAISEINLTFIIHLALNADTREVNIAAKYIAPKNSIEPLNVTRLEKVGIGWRFLNEERITTTYSTLSRQLFSLNTMFSDGTIFRRSQQPNIRIWRLFVLSY